MSNVLDRSFAILDLLAHRPQGVALGAIAAQLQIPPSATHRLLADLLRLGHVRQLAGQDYALTTRLPALALGFLHRAGIPDVVQPILDALAQDSGELVRLSVLDGPDLVWLGVAQGAQAGLRYDPGREQGVTAHLAYSASGRAWLTTLSPDDALSRVVRQGLAPPEGSALTEAPSIAQIAAMLEQDRAQGHAVAVDSFLAGMAAVAVPLRSDGGAGLGALSIAGPSVRLTDERMRALLPGLGDAAGQVAHAAAGSAFFRGRL